MIDTLKIFEVLKSSFGEAEARFLVEKLEKVEADIDVKVEKVFDTKKDILASKADLLLLRIDMEKGFKETFKWMFIFWIGQAAVIGGILIAIFFKIK
jgi:uncharacterized membrane protein